MNFNWKIFLKKRLERKVFTGLPLTIFVTVFLILLATFLGITDSIVNGAAIVKFDSGFARLLFSLRTPFLASFFYIITSFANPIYIATPLGISFMYLFFKKEFAYLYAILVTFIGTEASVFLLKIFINRDRPGVDIAYYLEGSKSFPSGHSAVAMAIFGFVTYYFIQHTTGKNSRTMSILAGAILIGLIGFSRLYLDVHFLSDVLGGFLIGGLWLVAGITFRERHFYVASLKKGKDTQA